MSRKTPSDIETEKFRDYLHNIVCLSNAVAEARCMFEAEIGSANAQFVNMLKSYGFKTSEFYNKAVLEYKSVGFASTSLKEVIKHVFSTYICPKSIKGSKSYVEQLECIRFSGSSYFEHSLSKCCDVSVVKFVIKDGKTGKCFNLSIPVPDNFYTRNPEELMVKDRGAICVMTSTDVTNLPPNERLSDFSMRPKVFCITYKADECAQAIKDYLTTNKHDFTDIMLDKWKNACYRIPMAEEYFNYEDVIMADMLWKKAEKKFHRRGFDDEIPEDYMPQIQIDQFVKHYKKYCTENLAYKCAQIDKAMGSDQVQPQ